MQLFHLIQIINWHDVAATFLLALAIVAVLVGIGYVCYCIIETIRYVTSEQIDAVEHGEHCDITDREAA